MSKPNGSADLGASASKSPVRRAAAGNGSAGRLIMNLGTSIVIKGDLRAAIDAKAVVIQGAVTGNVTGREKVEIQTTGSVSGDVCSPRLAIADGASIRGKVHVE